MNDLLPICACLSEAAYRVGREGDSVWENDLANRLPKGFHLVQTFDHGGTQAFLCHGEGKQYLVFRGTDTDNLADIVADLSAGKAAHGTKARQVHEGFLGAWDHVRGLVLQYMRKGTETVVTGHSLGGAVAYIAAIELQQSHSIKGVVTFGAPKVGNYQWTKHYNRQLGNSTVRVVRGADKVPRLWLLWKLGFKHPGNSVAFIDHLENITHDPPRLAILWCRIGLLLYSMLNFVRGRWSESFAGIKHHSMREYRRLVGK